jgi:UDP-glucose 4-epimerase
VAKTRAKPKKALVTGGAGFIGSHICEALVEKGYHLTIVDNLSSGSLQNISYVLKHPEVQFVQASITDLPSIKAHFKGVDFVFHQAAIASVPRSVDDPAASNETNITGTLNVLLAARDSGVRKVIYASSSAVYGDEPSLPKREDMLPDPQSPYALTKLAGEYYCSIFAKVYGLPTVSLRYFNVYGPRQNPNSQYAAVIPKFIQSISEGKAPIIYGDGEQTRDFAYVVDVVAANIRAAESDAEGIYNIGCGKKISINDLSAIILRKMGPDRVKPEYREERSGDIKHSLADINKARSFGYIPRYSLEKGISETLKNFKADF